LGGILKQSLKIKLFGIQLQNTKPAIAGEMIKGGKKNKTGENYMSRLSRDDFAEQAGTSFRGFINSDEPTEIKLVEVTELKETEQVENFSLIFEAPIGADVVTGLVKMEHDTLGSIDVGISPFGQDENTTKYEAVFSRFKSGQEPSEAGQSEEE
jgi:hypothetical protein